MTTAELINNLNSAQSLNLIVTLTCVLLLGIAVLRFIRRTISRVIMLAVIVSITGTNIAVKPLLDPQKLTKSQTQVLESFDAEKLAEFKEKYTVFVKNGETFVLEKAKENGILSKLQQDIINR